MNDLVSSSDFVVIGRATAVNSGRNAGSDVGGRLGFRDVQVDVEEVLSGSFDEKTLTLEELGWKEGKPFTVNEARWAETGDLMLMGLKATTNGESVAGPRFILTSTATRFFLGSGGAVTDNYLDSEEANSFVVETASMTTEQLIASVKGAG